MTEKYGKIAQNLPHLHVTNLSCTTVELYLEVAHLMSLNYQNSFIPLLKRIFDKNKEN